MAPAVMASSATTVAPFQGLKSTAGLPVSCRSVASLGSISNGGRIRCMQMWPIEGIKKFETLSYLPPLSTEALLKQVDFVILSMWVPCMEFSKVINEVEEVKKEYPDAYVCIIGFDNIRQMQCVSFIAFKPPSCEESSKA
ncbi:unnamed protein product [Alopecurus aequalis]